MKKTIFLALPLNSAAASRGAIEASFGDVARKTGMTVSVVGPVISHVGPATSEAVRSAIDEADVVVADVSGGRPNVLYEVGYAAGVNKPVLLLAGDPSEIPFDLREQHFLLYRGTSTSNLRSRLAETLIGLLAGSQLKPDPNEAAATQPTRLFISYSHRDAEYLDRILVHLRPLERAGLLDPWSDRRITAGDDWREEIRRALHSAKTAILLISADFLASDFVVTDELPPLLVAAEEHGTRIIPIIIKPSRFVRQAELSRFQALNDPATPVIRMSEAEREELYARLAEIVERDMEAWPPK